MFNLRVAASLSVCHFVNSFNTCVIVSIPVRCPYSMRSCFGNAVRYVLLHYNSIVSPAAVRTRTHRHFKYTLVHECGLDNVSGSDMTKPQQQQSSGHGPDSRQTAAAYGFTVEKKPQSRITLKFTVSSSNLCLFRVIGETLLALVTIMPDMGEASGIAEIT